MDWLKRLIARNAISGLSTPELVVGNAEQKRNADPRFFSIPRLEQRQSRKIGDEVMVFVQSPEPLPNDSAVGENVWVKITKKELNLYVGIAEDGLRLFPHLENPELSFGPECIAGVKLPSTHVLPYMQTCLASKAVSSQDQWPTIACRVSPSSKDDSGWRIFAESESISDATETIPVHQLMTKFQMLDSVLDEPDVAKWVWVKDSNEYKRAHANEI